ncbi:MAG: anti-sigma factor family protein [Xanthobacteraceae bacterium]
MNTANETERSEIEDLLPWHAAGTLDHRDMKRVEAALAEDPELARRYELVREELGETIHLNETLGAPSARAIEALFAKIDAEPARRPAMSLNLGARIGEFFAGLSPRTLAWSASAAALAIVLQAGLIAGIMLNETGPAGYATASAPTSVSGEGSIGMPTAFQGDYALIRFQPQANAAEITQFLETNKLSVAGGPSAGGLYRVRIAAAKLPKTDLDRLVKTLQQNKVIGFIAVTE